MKTFPKGIEIEINHDCNRVCAYCPNASKERAEQGSMDRGLFVEIMRQLRDLNYKGRISYHFYNEPMLCPDLYSFVELTREYLPECWIALFTNGTRLNHERLSRLLKLGVSRFTVTRHVKADLSEFEEAYGRLPEHEKKKIIYKSYKTLDYTNRGGNAPGVGPRSVVPPLSLSCFIPSCLLIITLKGNVIPCYEDYEQRHVMGNVKTTPLVEIWNSPRYVEFRRGLAKGLRSEYAVCRDCNNRQVIT